MNSNVAWSTFLTFRDPTWEHDYWDSRVNTFLVKCDIMMHAMGVVTVTLVVFKHSSNRVALFCGIPLWLSAAAQLCWSGTKKSSYLSWRSLNVVLLRILIVSVTTILACSIFEPGPNTLWDTMARIVFGTNIPALISSGVGLQLRFRDHVVVQFICTCIGMLSVGTFCSVWDNDYAWNFCGINSGMNHTISMLMNLGSIGIPHGVRYKDVGCSCWLTLSFALWSFGFLLSCVMVYCNEYYSRMLYINCRLGLPLDERGRLWRAWRGGVFVALWYVLVGLTIIWVTLDLGLKHIGEMANSFTCS